jgi:hypothetical protein
VTTQDSDAFVQLELGQVASSIWDPRQRPRMGHPDMRAKPRSRSHHAMPWWKKDWYLWCEDLIAQLRSGVPTKICCHLRPKGKQDKPSSASKRIPARLSRCRIQCRWQTWHLLNLIIIASQLLDRTKLSVLRPDFDGPLMQRDASRKRIQLAEMLFCSLSFQSLGDRTLVLSWANPTPSRQAQCCGFN